MERNIEADYGRPDSIFAIVLNYRIKRDFKSLINKPSEFYPQKDFSRKVNGVLKQKISLKIFIVKQDKSTF